MLIQVISGYVRVVQVISV